MPHQSVESAHSYLITQKKQGAFVVALEWTDSSHSLFDFNLPEAVRTGKSRLILLPGSEATGIAEPLLDLCEVSVHLPMHGQNSSLNVAVALGTAVYLLMAQLE